MLKSEMENLNNQPGPSEYLTIGFKAILLKGYSQKYNEKRDYKTAKQPVTAKFTSPDYKGLSLSEIEEAQKQDFWIGWLIPEGLIVIDTENPNVITLLDAIARDLDCSIQKTTNGKQYMFWCNRKDIAGSSEHFCTGGFPVTPRVAGKNYVIMPPTNNRTWEHWTSPDKLSQLPELLFPYAPQNQQHIALCLAWTVGEAYREGSLAGWEDIDAAFMAYLVEWGFSIELLQQCFYLVFMDDYDPRRTEEVYNRAKNLKENGNKILGAGSFVKKINDLKLDKIKRFLNNLINIPEEGKDETDNGSRTSLAHELIRIAEQYYLFHDDMKEAFAWINNEAFNVKGTRFRQFLSHELYINNGKVAGTEAIKQALTVIEGKAIFEGDLIQLHNRIAAHEGAFYYDTGDGRVIKTSASGWVIDNCPPILFKRYNHQLLQVEPQGGGRLDKIFDFMNVTNDEDQLLLEVRIVSYFVPDIPHPLLYAQGGQGSGKTKAMSCAKKLIDPSKLNVSIPSYDKRELIQTLYHHYFCVFDNISEITDWMSDILSVAITGGGQSKRKLYSDEDDVIFSFKGCIAITAINMCILKSDLFDRAILIKFDSISSTQRKEDKELNKQFENEKPRLLGAIFDTLSKAMKIYPNIKIKYLPRMADFCRWGCAIAVALGYDAEDFLKAYYKNIHKQHEEIIHVNTLAQSILTFMKDKNEWSGFVGNFYEELKKLVTVSKDDRSFPSYPNKLRSHIERINNDLHEYGIIISIDNSHGEKGTPVKITKTIEGSGESSKNRSIKNEYQAEEHEDIGSNIHTDLQVITPQKNIDISLAEDHEDQSSIGEDDIGVCYACGGHEYWRSITGSRWICIRCHPPVNERSVAERKYA